jgi:hypothetical protein
MENVQFSGILATLSFTGSLFVSLYVLHFLLANTGFPISQFQVILYLLGSKPSIFFRIRENEECFCAFVNN